MACCAERLFGPQLTRGAALSDADDATPSRTRPRPAPLDTEVARPPLQRSILKPRNISRPFADALRLFVCPPSHLHSPLRRSRAPRRCIFFRPSGISSASSLLRPPCSPNPHLPSTPQQLSPSFRPFLNRQRKRQSRPSTSFNTSTRYPIPGSGLRM